MRNRNFINFAVGSIMCLGLWVCPAGSAETGNAGRLPSSVQKILKKHRISRNSLSVYVHKVSDKNPLLSWKPEKARNPASTIKLLTTYVALEELGPAYTWKTEAYLNSPVVSGVTKNDLYLKGYGDPYLVTEYFWRLLRGLRKKGLEHVGGDLVLDFSYFKNEE